MGYDDIVWEFALCTLTYLIESWISPGCSYEFYVVYVQPDKSQYLSTATYEVHTFKKKNTRKSLRDILDCHFLFYMFLRSCKFVVIETRPFDIAHDEKVMCS